MKQAQTTDQQFFQLYKRLPVEKKKAVVAYVEKLSVPSETEPVKRPKFGSAKGLFTVKPGFDDPLEDFKEYM